MYHLKSMIGAAVLATVALNPFAGFQGQMSAEGVVAEEVAILAYASPFAEQVRTQGGDVLVYVDASDSPQADGFFIVDVIAIPQPQGGIELHEYIAVNRVSAEAYGDLGNLLNNRPVESPLLSGIQAIIRKDHNISDKTVRQFRDKQPILKPCRVCGG